MPLLNYPKTTTVKTPIKPPDTTDKEYLDMFYHYFFRKDSIIRPGSITCPPLRFSFNAAGEIVKIQEVHLSITGKKTYITISQDETCPDKMPTRKTKRVRVYLKQKKEESPADDNTGGSVRPGEYINKNKYRGERK